MAGNNLYFVHVNAIILLTDTNKKVVQVERQKETLNDLMNPRPTEKFHNISCYLYSRKYCVKWQVT